MLSILSVLHDIMLYQNEEGTLAKPGAYKSEKRKKELSRQKKQEEKRLRRLNKGANSQPDTEKSDTEEKGVGQES
jgi:hypothetical protein